MKLSEAKAQGQARAVKIGKVVSIRRVGLRQFEIMDGLTPFDTKLVILVHPSWVTDGRYERWGWPKPSSEFKKFNPDGWPLCPGCGQNELYCPDIYRFVRENDRNPGIQECIELGLKCYACSWQSGVQVNA